MTKRKDSRKNLPATTTEQEDIVTAGQRKINIIWEVTQAAIAIIVTIANVIVGVHLGLSDKALPIPPILSNSFFLIVGFYFSRTNHQAIGGVGRKVNKEQMYEGR